MNATPKLASLSVTESETWTRDDANDLYLIDRWGTGYFDIGDNGEMRVAPLKDQGAKISILEVVQTAIKDENLRAPILIRFQDILHHRVKTLNEAFINAIEGERYNGTYCGVFPIKVNQLREVVSEIMDAGRAYHYGIEVGSKPETFAALAMHTDNESLIVCNGYKDDAYIRTALFGRKLGKKVILIAEKLSEVRAICRVAKDMGVEPLIGLRVRLMTKSAGKWAESGGESAKFGLSTIEILQAADIMKEAGMMHAFKLLHFHIGSQVPDIMIIQRAVREAARYYAKIRRAGYEIDYVDVGGGLAIDYDGSKSTFHSSMNYSVEEYARDVVHSLMDVCDEEGVPHPHIVSESGRAIVAHHSVLVVEAFGAIEKTVETRYELGVDDHRLVKSLLYTYNNLTSQNLGESWHDCISVKEQAQTAFELGILDLPVKARVEELFWDVAERIHKLSRGLEESEVPDGFDDLKKQLADQYICNFSVFQSMLDHWALGALFPVVPIHRLLERPDQEATLVDITCDSDGKVSKFIDLNDTRDTLTLHPVQEGQPYYLGVFLTGAYQDIMGDIHNLFGRVNEVHVFLDEDEEGGYYIEETIEGNTVADVLQMTQYDAKDLAQRLKAQVDAAIKQDRIKPNEGMRMVAEYERGLKDQTYLTL